MPFALCPDAGPPYDGLPRLIRFETLGPLTVAELDRSKNLLRIDPARFVHLTEHQQEEVLRTHAGTVLEELPTRDFKPVRAA